MLRRSGQNGTAAQVARVVESAYVSHMLAIAQLVRQRGGTIVLVGQVYRDRQEDSAQARMIGAYRRALSKASQHNDVPYLEVSELDGSSNPDAAQQFDDDVHPEPQRPSHLERADTRFPT